MSKNSARQSSEHHRSRLEASYMELKQQVAAMSKRKALSPDEQLAVTEMKRRKLAMKDELAQLM